MASNEDKPPAENQEKESTGAAGGKEEDNPESKFAQPTTTHYFIKMLNDKGQLLRNYTQNIDTLERVAGIPADALVEAHGSFHTAHCLNCRKEYPHEWIRDEVFSDKVPHCTECEGVVKPDIIFFGESLPERFHQLVKEDMPKCDLLIVMGTSLVVQPFASLVDRVPETTPRLLINKEKCGQGVDFLSLLMGIRSGFQFDSDDNYRDVMWQGTTDDGCLALADLLGWKGELLKFVETEHKRLKNADETPNSKGHNKGGKTSVEDSSPTRSKPGKSTSTRDASSQGSSSKSTSPKSTPGKGSNKGSL